MPFLFIYLHNVRGIGLAVAGLILATHALVSIVAGPIFGSQIDRFGAKAMLGLSLAILTSATPRMRSSRCPGRGSSSPR